MVYWTIIKTIPVGVVGIVTFRILLNQQIVAKNI